MPKARCHISSLCHNSEARPRDLHRSCATKDRADEEHRFFSFQPLIYRVFCRLQSITCTPHYRTWHTLFLPLSSTFFSTNIYTTSIYTPCIQIKPPEQEINKKKLLASHHNANKRIGWWRQAAKQPARHYYKPRQIHDAAYSLSHINLDFYTILPKLATKIQTLPMSISFQIMSTHTWQTLSKYTAMYRYISFTYIIVYTTIRIILYLASYIALDHFTTAQTWVTDTLCLAEEWVWKCHRGDLF